MKAGRGSQSSTLPISTCRKLSRSMNGLRVYVDPRRSETRCAVFYTRRAGGPYYRWQYEEFHGHWLGSRMHAFDLPVTELVSAAWKEIPAALKTTLDEHYVD